MFMKTVLTAKPWVIDPTLVPIPWRDEESYLKRDSRTALRVAVLWDDGVVKPHPPITRALKEVVKGLIGTPGIEVIDWKPYKHDLAWELIVSLAAFSFNKFYRTGLLTLFQGGSLLYGRRRSNHRAN